MKRKNIVLLLLLTALALAAAIGFAIRSRSVSSPQYPEIRFAQNTISASVDASEAELLRGVTAVDPEDGDVTESLVVEGFSSLVRDNEVKVTYVAFDSQSHVTKAQRTVKFTDYTGPRFTMSGPMIFKRANDIDVLENVGAVDPFDGDISGRVKYSIATNAISLNEAGEYEIKLMVTNRIGDTETLTLPVEITAQSVNSENIELSDYIVYLNVGDDFNARDYVKGYTTSSGSFYEGSSGLSIKSDVDTDEAGIYSVTYTYNGRPESRTRLVVVVE